VSSGGKTAGNQQRIDLHRLSYCMTDAQFDHVVAPIFQSDKVVVYPWLIRARNVKVEVFDLNIIVRKLFGLKLGNVSQKATLFLYTHSPYNNYPILK
jgi:hypothetical protein